MVLYKRANRQYVAMSENEVWSFIESRNKLFVGFTREDGFPHVSPLWFCVENRRIYLRTHDYKIKTRLAKTGKACCVIDDGFHYRELRGVIVWGKSRVLADEETITRIDKKLDKKYEEQQWRPGEMPSGWVTERKLERRAFIEVIPEKIDSWDNSKV